MNDQERGVICDVGDIDMDIVKHVEENYDEYFNELLKWEKENGYDVVREKLREGCDRDLAHLMKILNRPTPSGDSDILNPSNDISVNSHDFVEMLVGGVPVKMRVATEEELDRADWNTTQTSEINKPK